MKVSLNLSGALHVRWVVALFLVLGTAGCQRESAGVPAKPDPATLIEPPRQSQADNSAPRDPRLPLATSGILDGDDPGSASSSNDTLRDNEETSSNLANAATPVPKTNRADAGPRPLRQDLTPDELAAFLSGADDDLRVIVQRSLGQTSSVANEKSLVAELRRIVTLKREASERLANHPGATAKLVSIGKRGTLQSLSHLASLGDLDAADELEQLARSLSDDSDSDLRSDSRLVLIGLALEQVRFVKSGAVHEVTTLIRDFAAKESSPDVAALMVMGQALEVMLDYDHPAEASEIGRIVAETYSSSADPSIREIAGQLSGLVSASPALSRVEKLRQQWIAPSTTTGSVAAKLSEAAWREALVELIGESDGLGTAQALAQLSLETEAFGREDLAEVTYELLRERFSDRQDAAGREAQTALLARENRQSVLGQRLDPDLPELGQPPESRTLSMKSFRGRVVLMPFWSSQFPASLALLPQLRQIRDRYPSQVEIVGMNLDVADATPEEFARQAELGFPSFRAVSDPRHPIANDVAFRFGAATVNFVVIVDPEGHVAAVNFSGRELEQQVAKLFE